MRDRVAKVLHGRITVGGHDVAKLPLSGLRRFVWTVPQDVTLFSGTVRSNLDPEGTHSDDELWSALDRLCPRLADHLREDGGEGLEAEVAESGENFSHGRRQEVALTRAALAAPGVLLLDEATGALDAAAEAALHRALPGALPEGTTLVSVAHRLSSIVGYDRVVVMGDGRILEDGRPRELLRKPMGFFSALWRAAGEKPL